MRQQLLQATGKVQPAVGESDARQGGRAAVSFTEWMPDHEMSAEEWASAGRRIGRITRASQWWIGDWMRYGNRKWGERYVQAARITGYDVSSLRNIAWVCSQFEPSLRNDNLTWSHHALLAPLERKEKEFWLREAVQKRLTVADLRMELRGHRNGAKEGPQSEAGSGSEREVVCPHCGRKFPDTS